LPLGIIIKGIGGFYYVSTADGRYECKARGIFRKDGLTPLPGDNVKISIIDEAKKLGSIDEIIPRTSQLVRPAVANINQVVVVIASKSPEPDFLLLDKLLITTGYKNLEAVICINKIDLDADGEYKKIASIYRKLNYTVILSSSKIDKGLDSLKTALAGKVSVFAGQSGVGKSTILNRIMDSWLMETGEVSEKISRGRHTTRHAELVQLQDGGYVVDTPGFSSFELTDIEYDELQLFYPEFCSYINSCRFTRCSHISEPGCLVKEALEQGLIDKDRYSRYTVFYNLLKQNKDNQYRGNKQK
jgi:ribosome biogenesis GTPase